jgi:hypothetical protein
MANRYHGRVASLIKSASLIVAFIWLTGELSCARCDMSECVTSHFPTVNSGCGCAKARAIPPLIASQL